MPPLNKDANALDILPTHSSLVDCSNLSGWFLPLVLMLLLVSGCQSQQNNHDSETGQPTDPAIGLESSAPPEEAEFDNLWERIRAGYQLQEHLADANPRVERQRLWFASRPAVIANSAERGSPYLHYVVEQLDEAKMPLELSLLPIIESSYNPMAYSRSHAAGIWQFIPTTGRAFNLHQTRHYDGRRDIPASTQAAILYLNKLHAMFGNDWLLALAAYNAGEGTVGRAIARNEKLGLPTDYWNLQLPNETMEYVPKLLAVAQIILTPKVYSVDLPEIANKPHFEMVPFNQSMSLSNLAQIARVDADEFLLLNPAYKNGITLDGPQRLLVPAAVADQFEANLALHKPQQRLSWEKYQVRAGDSLHSIANRYYVTVETLKQVNQLPTNRLSVGQILRVPVEPGTGYRPPISQVAHKPAQYTVQKGDNLSLIAQRHRVSVADLKHWNKLRSPQIQVGQQLLVAQPAPARKSAAVHQVRSGDSLHAIAKRYRISPAQLKQWNPKVTNSLTIGQKIWVSPPP